jgi:hypothetical protein
MRDPEEVKAEREKQRAALRAKIKQGRQSLPRVEPTNEFSEDRSPPPSVPLPALPLSATGDGHFRNLSRDSVDLSELAQAPKLRRTASDDSIDLQELKKVAMFQEDSDIDLNESLSDAAERSGVFGSDSDDAQSPVMMLTNSSSNLLAGLGNFKVSRLPVQSRDHADPVRKGRACSEYASLYVFRRGRFRPLVGFQRSLNSDLVKIVHLFRQLVSFFRLF